MKPARRGRGASSEKAMSLEALQAWLRALEPPPRADGVSMLDGYLTAIIIGPRSIPPDKWFVDLLGEHWRIATAAGKTLAAIQAIAARFNAISENLSLAPNRHAPIFEKMDDGTVLADPWCMGFLAAMQLRWKDWAALRDLRQIEHGPLLPILLHCTDAHGDPMLGPPREGPETEKFLREAYHDIPPMVIAIREFWMPLRVAESKRPG
jgi:uncharacterized protein